MLRQNRYKDSDFTNSQQMLEIIQDEILISREHDIVICLEPYQVEKFEDIQIFIRKIIQAIPKLDNETQDYYETISDDTDFPHSLSVVYIRDNEVILDYWSDQENNTFDIIFRYENDTWILKKWGWKEVPSTWYEL